MPRKRSLWYVMAGVFVLFTMILSACGPTSGGGNNTSTTPVKGGTLIDGLFEEPDTLMSGVTSETFAVMVDQALWAPLFYGDDHGNINAGLATVVPSVQNGGISADGKTYTIHLRPNLKWSDGQPLTADDVVWTLQLEMNPAYGTKSALDTGNIASVTAPDPSTVVITLKKVEPPFLATGLVDPGNFQPMPKHIYGTMAPGDIAKVFTPMVTSGPFMFKSEADHVKGDHITLYRNPNYYRASEGLPYLDSVTFKIITSTNTILTALQSGTIDTSWFLSVTDLAAYRAIPGYTQTQDTVPVTWEALWFNESNPILADPVVRQVIAGSISFNDILAILKGTAKRTCDDAIGTFGHDPQLTCYNPIDATTAGNMLTQDGWVMGSDGYRHKGGKTLELRYTTTANNARRSQTQQIIQQNLKNVGIKIDIINQDASTYFGSTLYNYSAYDIAEFASSAGYDPDDHTYFMCNQLTSVPGGFNVSHYCNPTVDAQYNIELTNPDQNARKAAFTAIHKQLLIDLPVVWMYSYPDLAEYKNTVHNYKPAATGETWNIWEWWCTNGKC
jgi:peptide/nickel transport system substrate-binding protein